MTPLRREEDAKVVAALAAVGINVRSVFDLVNTRASYPKAIPVLVDVLSKVNESYIKEGVVRALACKEARGHAEALLIKEFLNIPPSQMNPEQLLKWAIGNTLSALATDSLFHELAFLAKDRRHGKAREMIVWALGSMRNQRSNAISVLIDLVDDEEVVGHAVVALGKLRAKEAEAKIQDLLTHPKDWVRQEAAKALKRIRQA